MGGVGTTPCPYGANEKYRTHKLSLPGKFRISKAQLKVEMCIFVQTSVTEEEI